MKLVIMARRRAHTILIVAALCLSVLALGSCDAGPAGIFARVASETPTNATMTKALAFSTPSFVARLGTTYYAGIGTLWIKKDGAITWSTVDKSVLTEIKATSGTPSSPSPLYASAGTVIGSELYVLFNDSGSGQGLGVWKTSDGSTWSNESGLPSTAYVRTLLSANNTLFAIVQTARTKEEDPVSYSIYYHDGSTFVITPINEATDMGMPNSVAYDGSAYWITAGNKMISGILSTLAVVSGPSTSSYGGICNSGTALIASTRDGYIYYSDNAGASWIKSDQLLSTTKKVFSLSAPTVLSYDAKKTLVVGTNKIVRSASDQPPVDGYLEFDISTVTTSFPAATKEHTLISTATNFASSLANKSVGTMPVFDEGSGILKAFALSDGNGLWSNTHDATGWYGWIRE